MDETKSETGTEAVKSEDSTETEAVALEEVEETEKPEETPAELKARLARAEKKIERMKIEAKVEKKVESTLKERSSELDETQLDYLDLKGISEQEDIEVIQKVMERTGLTLRQVLKDDYVVSKLESLKKERGVKAAIPTSTRRSGGISDNEDYYFQQYEQSGKLPDGISHEMKTRLVNRKAAASDFRRNPFE